MNCLTEWHHGGLYFSSHLLLEKRLGWKLFRPIGLEWAAKNGGPWHYSYSDEVIHQYLDLPNDITPHDGVYEMPWHEGEQKFTMRAVTLEAFKRMDWGVVMPSVSNHDAPFAKLRDDFAPKAVLVRQMGNVNDHFDPSVVKNVLNSTNTAIPDRVNTVRYHQEFSLEDYRPEQPPNTTTVKSFLHAFPQIPDHTLWWEMEKAMPDFTFKEHGVLCRDGNLPSALMPAAIRSTAFTCHLKYWGDGFGHSAHNSAACGKPLITKHSYFQGMMVGELLEDGKTSIDISDDVASNVEKLRYWSEPSRYAEMSQNMRERFLKVVDFDSEFKEIKRFFDKAQGIVSIE